MPGCVIADAVLDGLSRRCAGLLAEYHREHPLHAGLRVAELRQKLFGNADTAAGNAVLGELSRERAIQIENGRAALPGFEVRLTKRQQAVRERILEAYRTAGYETLPPEEFTSLLAPNERKDGAPVFENLLASGELVLLAPQIVWHRETFERARAAAEAHFSQNRELGMPQFRDMLGTSRKYAMAMLDYLDSMRVTRKTGDMRTLFRGFEMLT
jgi:selenocysteine-specific elongation factor